MTNNGSIGDLLENTSADLESLGLSPDTAALSAIYDNLYTLTGILIEIGQTGADLTNKQLQGLVQGLLETVSWLSARTEAKQAWDEVGDGPIFSDEL